MYEKNIFFIFLISPIRKTDEGYILEFKSRTNKYNIIKFEFPIPGILCCVAGYSNPHVLMERTTSICMSRQTLEVFSRTYLLLQVKAVCSPETS
jgi:hypothetical protein